MKIIFKLLSSVLSLLLIATLAAGSFFAIKGHRMYTDAIASCPPETMIEKIRNQEDFIPYESLPALYVDAVVAVEDKRFWEHHGIDCLATARALWNDLRARSFIQGGSTITQQLAKNLYFTQEKKLERKIAELFVALRIEDHYTKEEIFELYANTIYFGSGYYGIYDAAMGYYGKPPSELSDAQVIMLAGLPNAPSAYSLDQNPQLAKQRMKQVLDRMVSCSILSQEEADLLFEKNE